MTAEAGGKHIFFFSSCKSKLHQVWKLGDESINQMCMKVYQKKLLLTTMQHIKKAFAFQHSLNIWIMAVKDCSSQQWRCYLVQYEACTMNRFQSALNSVYHSHLQLLPTRSKQWTFTPDSVLAAMQCFGHSHVHTKPGTFLNASVSRRFGPLSRLKACTEVWGPAPPALCVTNESRSQSLQALQLH